MLKNIKAQTILLLILTTAAIAQPNKTSASFSSAGMAALAYFEKVQAQGFDLYLKSLRPDKLAPELKARLIANLPRQDIVTPSAEGRAKLAAVEPILKYYERNSVIDLTVLRVRQPVVVFYGGAAVLITEGALELLNAKELQAVVAHELGHEYSWNEWQQAQLNNQYEKMQEIELRCDGMAIITMNQLGLDPAHFISAISKLTRAQGGHLINTEHYTSLDERIRFIQSMIDLVKARARATGTIAKN